MFCRFGISSEKKVLDLQSSHNSDSEEIPKLLRGGGNSRWAGGESDGVRPVMSIIGHRKGIQKSSYSEVGTPSFIPYHTIQTKM